MEQQRNASPTRRGSGHLDETIGHGAVGYERAMIEFIRLAPIRRGTRPGHLCRVWSC